MRWFLKLVAANALISVVTLGLVGASESKDAGALKMVIGASAGPHQRFATELRDALLSMDGHIHLSVMTIQNPLEALNAVEAGAVDLAITDWNLTDLSSPGAVGVLASPVGAAGPRSAPGQQQDGATVLWAAYPNAGVFAVRGDSPFFTLADLHSYPIAWGPFGFGPREVGYDVVAGVGLHAEKDFQPVSTDTYEDARDRVLSYAASGLFAAWPGYRGFEGDTAIWGAKMRFIAPSPAEVGFILKRRPNMVPLTIPAKTFPGQKKDWKTVGTWTVILARPGVDEDRAAALVTALSSLADDAPKKSLLRFATAENTRAAVPFDRLHPLTKAAVAK